MIYRTYRIPISDPLVTSRLNSWYGAYRKAWNSKVEDVASFKDTYPWAKDIPDAVILSAIKRKGKDLQRKKSQRVTLPHTFTRTGFFRDEIGKCAIGFQWFDTVVWLQMGCRVNIIPKDVDEFKFLKQVHFKLINGRWWLHISSSQYRETNLRYDPRARLVLNLKQKVKCYRALKKKKIVGRSVRKKRCRLRESMVEMTTTALSNFAGDIIGDGMMDPDPLEEIILGNPVLEKWKLVNRFSSIFKSRESLYAVISEGYR